MASTAHNVLGVGLIGAAFALGAEKAYNYASDAIAHQQEICETDVHASHAQVANHVSTETLRQDCENFDKTVEEVAGGAILLLIGGGGISVIRRARGN